MCAVCVVDLHLSQTWAYVGSDELNVVVSLVDSQLTWISSRGLFSIVIPAATATTPAIGNSQIYARSL